MINRRRFLQGTAALSATLLLARKTRADAFGAFPTSSASVALTQGQRAKNVLEVYLYGGLSAWETLYFVESMGAATGTMSHTFRGGGPGSFEEALSACGQSSAAPLGVPFAQDARGVDVQLGPFARALSARSDVTDRMRVVVQQHTLAPHEAAVPQALTGRRVGAPNLAGLGAHIQRHFNDVGDGTRQSPFSFMFSTGEVPSDNVQAGLATGLHPGSARPLRIKVDNLDELTTLLDRPGIPRDARTAHDELLTHYIERYQKRLRFAGKGDPLRSPRLKDLVESARAVGNVDAVKALLDPHLLRATPDTVCGDSADINTPQLSLRMAAHLLTHPVEPARYVCVVDTGLLQASGGGGYDTHLTHCHDTARNLQNLLHNLMGIINAPGENDANKLNLDDTLIVLNTEFGRTPQAQDGGDGTNHFPEGYVTAFLGGPIVSGRKGVVGALGDDGVATDFITPAENRIAALAAMGIYPFSPEAFSLSEVQGGVDDVTALRSVQSRVLGVES